MKLIRRVKSKGYESFTFLGMRLYRRVENKKGKRISFLGIPVYSKKTKDYRTVRRVLFWKTRRYDKQRQLMDMLESGVRERAALKQELTNMQKAGVRERAALKQELVDMLESGVQERAALKQELVDMLESGVQERAALKQEIAAGRGESKAMGTRLRTLEVQSERTEKHLLQLQSQQYVAGHGTELPLISVILPVYNGIRFLRETLDSILAQTFPYFELICVDDGSSDGSEALLDEYALCDERITVIHQENMGAGPARNNGLDAARGRYVLFLDADDIYLPDMFSVMFLRAERYRADVVVCRSETFTHTKNECKSRQGIQGRLPSEVFSGKDVASNLFRLFIGWAWDKLFRRDLLMQTGLRFPASGSNEDAYFVYLNLASAHRITTVSDILIQHREHPNSLEALTRGKNLEHIRVFELMADWLHERRMFDLFKWSFYEFAVRIGRWALTSRYSFAEVFQVQKYTALKSFLEKYFSPASYPRALYQSDKDFDFAHSMFVKKPCRLRYSVVMACYNVEKYIDEALESLAQQTVDFVASIECILIDDGSTDGTAEKIRLWAEKFPNITCIHKENGGVSSARNAGLAVATCPWVTFMDPDDFLHPDYFYQIDSALAENEEETAFVAGRMISYWEKNQSFGKHPLDFKYTENVRAIALSDVDDEIQLAVNHAFLRRDVLIENSLYFSPLCRPKFEDAHLIIRYSVFVADKKAVYVKNAFYLYRKREDGTSLVDTSWQRKEQYFDLWEFGYVDAAAFCKEACGFVSKFVQNILLYDIHWFFQELANTSAKTAFLSHDEREKFWKLLECMISYFDVDVLVHSARRWLTREDRVAMVERILRIPYPDPIFTIQKYDRIKELVLISHIEAEGNSGTVFIGGKPAVPVLTKTQKKNFAQWDWVTITHEWYSVAGVGDKANIRVVLADAREVDLFVPQKHRGKILSLGKLKSWFAQTPSKNSSRFAGAWLIMDRDECADDNGEHFYRWLMKHHPEQLAFFVLRKGTKDWDRLEKEGFALVDFCSRDYEELFKNCSKIISAHADRYIYSAFPEHRYSDFVFLQHGIIKDDISGWVNSFPASLFLTSAEREYESIVEESTQYKYSRKEVVLTGLPRHDTLLTSSVEKKRQILIIPTWRNYIVGKWIPGKELVKNPAFVETEYFKAWHSFLHSDGLRNLAERYGFEVVFFPHQLAQPYLEDFNCPAFIRSVKQGECGLQELFLSSSLMITDFSSVAMDMAYADRSVLYYQFDEEEFFLRHLGKGYFDYRRDGFGPVVTEEDALLRELEALLARDGEAADEYRKRADSFFAFRDGKCCERTYEAILALDSPEFSF